MSKKLRIAIFKLIDLMVIFTMVFASPMSMTAAAMAQDSGPTLATDKLDYEPGEAARLMISGFPAGEYVLAADRDNDDDILDWGSITVNDSGILVTESPELNAEAGYEVRAYASGWNGDWEAEFVARATFTVTAPPGPTPTVEPTQEPTNTPTEEPTAEPTQEPTNTPTDEPTATAEPTAEPTNTPTDEPTATEPPTTEPTNTPTDEPTSEPTNTATDEPTQEPTNTPTDEPTSEPTNTPTDEPTQEPTATEPPTATSTTEPTATSSPTITPTSSEAPTIQSDYADYNPGQLVTLTGASWAGDTRVSISVDDDLGQNWRYTDSVVVQPDGTILDSFNLPTHFVARYFVTARGAQTGRVATTTFTDANPSADLDQCANDPAPSPNTNGCNTSASEWDNGNLGASKSVYFEGDSIPYRLKFDNLNLSSHTVVIEWDTTKNGKHAIDYITTFNRTVANANPCLGVSGCSLSTFTTFPIPADPQVTGAGVTPVAGNFTLYGGTITSVSAYSYPDGTGFTGDKSARISITFTASVANPVLAWGGHIATRADWGAGNSAVTISGSPYHTRLISLNGSGGNQDRSLSADAVIFPASITIIKDAVPNDAQDFNFTSTGGLTPASFSLDDDADGTFLNTRTYSGITNFTTYTFTEAAVSGWALSFNNPVCTVTSANGGSQSSNVGTRTVSINLAEGENVTCTFINTKQQGTIIVKKVMVGGTDTFTFTGTPSGSISTNNGTISANVNAGQYQSTETVPAGWDLTSISCDDSDSTGNVGTKTVTFNVASNETVTCTFTNTKQAPALTLVKTATPSTYSTAGQTINYSYLVTNSGNVKLAGPVTVTDDKATTTCPNVNTVGNLDSFLDPGESITCAASYTITQADLNTGSVTNIAQAHADGTVSNTDTETVTAAQSPALSINKTVTDVDGAGPNGSVDESGDVISYSIVVTNDGNVTLTGVTVSDPLLGTLSCTPTQPASLTPGASMTCTGSYTATQSNIEDNGGGDGDIDNTATADSDQTGPSSDSETVPVVQNASLIINKTITDVDGGGATGSVNAAGDIISYQIVATNNGNVTLTGVTVSDPLLGTLSCIPSQPATLAPGASITCTGTYTATQNDINTNGGGDGDIDNTATTDSDQTNAVQDSEFVPVVQTSSLTIDKTVTDVDSGGPGGSVDEAGDVISYAILVTNTGNTTLTGVSVSDPLLGTLVCTPTQPAMLAPGESMTCTGSYTVTQGDIDGNGGGDGDIDNTATADSDQTGPSTDSEAVPVVQTSSLAINKTVTDVDGGGAGGSVDEAGDVISYQIIATNNGNTTLTGVTVSDPLLGTLSCTPTQPATLAPGASITCTGTYAATQADIDGNGGSDSDIDNTATADSDQTGPTTDSEDVPVVKTSSLAINKTVTDVDGGGPTGSVDEAGDVISYSILVTNTGNTTLTGISVSDPLLSNLDCDGTAGLPYVTTGFTILVDGSLTCTGSYTVTQADIDGNGGGDGDIDNTATADSDQTDPASDSEFVPIDQNPSLIVNKTVIDVDGGGAGGSVDEAGDVISYQIVATNNGNQTLTGVTVSDPLLGMLSCTPTQPATLAPGESMTCTGSYTASQGDIDDNGGGDGDIDNTATVDSDQTEEETDSEDVPVVQAPALAVEKVFTGNDDEDSSNTVSLDDTLHYTITATNTGNTTLHNVTVSDDLTGDDTSCASVAPLGTCVLNVTYVVTQADVDAGNIHNVGTADSDETPPTEDPEDVPVPQNPALAVDKAFTSNDDEDGSGTVSLGDTLHYTITATNTGNVTLHNVTVTDSLTGDDTSCASVAPLGTCVLNVTYMVTQVDVDAGNIHNVGTADSDETPPTEDPEDVPVPQNPAISINKTTNGSDGSVIPVGSPITWTYVVTNTGNVTLTNITVRDNNGTPGNTADDFNATCPKTTLAVGESMTCTASGTAVAGHYTNTGTATGTPPVGNPVTDTDDSDYFSAPRLIVIKHVINNNGGNKTAADFTLDSGGTNDTPDNFAGNEAGTTVTLDAGSYDVTEMGPSGYTDSYSADCDGTIANGETKTCTVTNDDKVASLTVTKTSSTENVCNSSNTQVTYTYVVTNTGDVALTVNLADDKLGDVDGGTGVLLNPGQSQTFTRSTAINGTVTNTVTASGTATSGQTATATASATVTGHNCTISITKTPNKAEVCNGKNTSVTYTYVVTNNSDFYSVSGTVTDNPLGSVGTFTNLAPGASQTFTKSATINATTTNTGTATGTFNDGKSTSATATASATVTGRKCQISITKTASPTTLCSNAGSLVTYTYVVKNDGTATLTNVSVVDNKLGTIASGLTLTPGQSQTFTKTVTLSATTTNVATASGTVLGVTVTATASATVTVSSAFCPFTPGYWKTHLSEASKFLPIKLGNYSVSTTTLVTKVFNAMNCSSTKPADAIGCLAGHLLAAKLNVANGGGNACINNVIAKADAFLKNPPLTSVTFGGYTANSINYIGPTGNYNLSTAQRNLAISLKNALDKYNNNLGCP
jgi:uncharacterized repeat protein (TIGR01451 family)